LPGAATERFALRREPAALGVGESQAPTAELLAQDAVLLLEVLEDLALAAVYPAREHQEQELERRDRHAQQTYRAGPDSAGPIRERRAARCDVFRWFTGCCLAQDAQAPSARNRVDATARSGEGGVLKV
jgi:hypothetical protein